MYQREIDRPRGGRGTGRPCGCIAQQSTVQIYGKLYPEFTVGAAAVRALRGRAQAPWAPRPPGLNLKSRNSVDASNSRIGFRGTEGLGGGLNAIWQIESTVPLDQAAGSWRRARPSSACAGIRTVKLGNMDTVYKRSGIRSGPWAFPAATSCRRATSFPRGCPSAAARELSPARQQFGDVRVPTMGGFQLFAQYSPGATAASANGENRSATATTGSICGRWAPPTRSAGSPCRWATRSTRTSLRSGGVRAPAQSTDGSGSAHSKDTSTRGTGDVRRRRGAHFPGPRDHRVHRIRTGAHRHQPEQVRSLQAHDLGAVVGTAAGAGRGEPRRPTRARPPAPARWSRSPARRAAPTA